MSPQQASELSVKLFYDNFPKLQEDAEKLVDERITEFTDGLISSLSNAGFENYKVFSDPDMQYTLYEAQKGYARNGGMDLLSTLIATIEERCKANNNSILKITLNESVNILPRLLPQHINMITMVFLVRESVRLNIKDIDSLRDYINEVMTLGNAIEFSDSNILHLLQLGIAREITFGEDLGVLLSTNYKDVFSFVQPEKQGLTKFGIGSEDIMILDNQNETVDIKTFLVSKIPAIEVLFDLFDNRGLGSINLTNTGKIIAIKNWEIKTGKKIDPSVWIK